MKQQINGRVITKSELIDRLGVKQSHLPIKDVEFAVKNILEYLSNSLSKGKRVEIRGFGSFSLRYRKPWMARNPKTGARVPMASKSIPHFKPGKPLRDRVKNISSPQPQQAQQEPQAE